ncbi:MAG: hypothetical protein R3B06_06740 [Kofleriaceae bacterium]
MISREEEHAITAIAALLAKVAPSRRSAVASAALHRLAAPAGGGRDAPTQRVARVPVKAAAKAGTK